MITCSKAKELMDRYIDGDISERDMTAFEDHISSCDDCRESYELTSQLVSALRESAVQPPADFTARVMERVRQETVHAVPSKKKSGLQAFRGWKAYGSACAAVLLLAVIGKTAVYDQYFRVTQPPQVDTAYIDQAPNVPDVSSGQIVPSDGAAQTPEQSADAAAQAQAQPEQQPASEGLVARIEGKIKHALGTDTPTAPSAGAETEQQPSDADTQASVEQPAAGQQPVAQQPEAVPPQAPAVTNREEGTLKTTPKEEQPKVDAYAAGTESAAGTEGADQSVLYNAAESEAQEDTAVDAAMPKVQAEPPVAAGSGGGGSSAVSGGSSGGSGSAVASAVQTPKVCRVTISKSGEGNMLAVQRQVSANVDGSIDTTDSGMTVTVDPADFEETLEEIQATGFVESVEITEGSGDQSVFYIQ